MEEPRTISSDLIRGHIDTIILNSLIDGDKYAQLISDTIETSSDGKYSINQATLYSSLKRLESIGYVTSYWFDAIDGRRKYFSITPKGREIVESNLLDWSYSKSIIEKLIGLNAFVVTDADTNPTSAPISSNEQQIKPLEEVANEQGDSASELISNETINNNSASNTVSQNNNETTDTVNQTEINENNDTITPVSSTVEQVTEQDTQIASSNTQTPPQATDENENIDFRAVLGDLITPTQNNTPNSDSTSPNASEGATSIDTQEPTATPQSTSTQEIIGFNDTISANINHTQTDSSNIDYTELSLKAAQKGYKVRYSSKNSAKTDGTLYINKVNFWAIFYTFILATLQCVTFLLFFDKKFAIDTSLKIIGGAVLISLPIISGIIYGKAPKKTSKKQIHADSILTVGIIIFNILLLTFALGLLLNLNYTNKYTLLYAVVVPAHICIDFLVFSIIRFFIGKKPNNKVQNKK